MESIKVFLTTPQHKKMQGGSPFQLSATQLKAGSGKHEVEIKMTEKNYKTLLNNVSKNKGFRFSSDKIIGGAVEDTPAPVVDIPEPVSEKMTSGGKLVKGSSEMREHMAKLRGMRKGKGVMKMDEIQGEGVFDDIGRDLRKTFNPALGRKIKRGLKSPIGKKILKTIADAGIGAVSTFAGQPIAGVVGSQLANQAIDGLGVADKRHYLKKNHVVEGGTLLLAVPGIQTRRGGVVKGKGFTSVRGTHYGGSFLSP
jgi:hypothetical protein